MTRAEIVGLPVDKPDFEDRIPGNSPLLKAPEAPQGHVDMNSSSPSPGPGATHQKQKMDGPCAHARVQIVARGEDGEFVECLECREIFEASEFKDMGTESGDQEGAA